MIQIIVIIKDFLNKMKKDRVGVYTAQASYFMILSIFPLIMVILSIIKFSGLPENTVLEVAELLPASISPLYSSIVSELYEKTTGTILSVTAIAAIWSASKGVLSILRGLNEIFEVNEDKNYFYLRFLSLFYLILFLVAIALSMVFMVFGNKLYHLAAAYLPIIAKLVKILLQNRILIAFCLLTLLFTFMFRMVRNPEYKLKNCFPGAVFTTAGWMGFSVVFSFYADRSTGYSYMYGSLTSIILFMLWMYTCFYIFFIGAELVTFFHQWRKRFKK